MTIVWYALIDASRAPFRTASLTSAELVTGQETVAWLKKATKSQYKNLLAFADEEDLYVFRDLDNAADDDPCLRDNTLIGSIGKDPRRPLVVVAPNPGLQTQAKEWVKTNQTFKLPRTESGQPLLEIPPQQYSPASVSAFQSIAVKTKLVKNPTDLLVRPMRH